MYNVVVKKVHVRYLISWWVSCNYEAFDAPACQISTLYLSIWPSYLEHVTSTTGMIFTNFKVSQHIRSFVLLVISHAVTLSSGQILYRIRAKSNNPQRSCWDSNMSNFGAVRHPPEVNFHNFAASGTQYAPTHQASTQSVIRSWVITLNDSTNFPVHFQEGAVL